MSLQHNKGFIDFRQYIVGTACLARIAAKKEVAESALKVNIQSPTSGNSAQVNNTFR